MIPEDKKQKAAQDKKLNAEAIKNHVQLGKSTGKIFNFLNDFSLLIFHACLTVLIIYDIKDGLTLVLFTIEMITIPIHLMNYMKRKQEDKHFYRTLFKSYKPIFVCCLLFCLLRYLLFFLRYSSVQYYSDKFFFALDNSKLSEDVSNIDRNWLYFAFFSSKDNTDSQRNFHALVKNFEIEFAILVLTIFTYVAVRKNAKQEAKRGGDVLSIGLLAAVTNIKGTEMKMLKIKNSLDLLKSKSKITQRTFRFLLFAIMAQATAILLSTKALTHYPNIIKAVILSLFMFYVLNLFSNLRRIFTKYDIVKRLKCQINYFRANFVEELRVVNKYTFEISEEIENMELMQNSLYFERIMYEYESVFEKIDSKFWWILVMPLIIANMLNLLLHVWF
jgi:hypothetical protein